MIYDTFTLQIMFPILRSKIAAELTKQLRCDKCKISNLFTSKNS